MLRSADMAELKTKRTKASVDAFLAKIADEGRRKDCKTLVRILKKATGAKPEMWGPSIVGFGSYHYKYESGREGDWFLSGFSPRKQDLTLYLMGGFEGRGDLLAKLGKHKTGRACLYVKRLSDVDLAVLQELATESVKTLKRMQP
jgi:hypothetical protein